MAIGENIKKLRVSHGLSQAELADIAGVTDKAVSSWEQNKAVPRMGPIQKMADFFSVKKSDIIEPTANTYSPTAHAGRIMPLNLDEAKLLSDYRNLSGNNRQAINVMMALFLSQQSDGNGFNQHAAAI